MIYFLIVLMVITLATVLLGFLLLTFNYKLHLKYSNKLMAMRVLLQAVSIMLLLLLFTSHNIGHLG
jgi:hypothetical protein